VLEKLDLAGRSRCPLFSCNGSSRISKGSRRGVTAAMTLTPARFSGVGVPPMP
jgi:hypothetical protein